MAPRVDPLTHLERARNDATKLRNNISLLQVRLEQAESDRNCADTAKSFEFAENKGALAIDQVHEELVKKKHQLSEVNRTLDTVQHEMQSLRDEKEELGLLRQQDKEKMEALSNIIRSLQCPIGDDPGNDGGGELVLTPERALDLTLTNLRFHVELLEDEQQHLVLKCTEQEKKIAQLEEDNEMKDVKIGMLEELFRAMNERRNFVDVTLDSPTTSVPDERSSRKERDSRRHRIALRKEDSWIKMAESGKRADSSSRKKEGTKSRRRSKSTRRRDEEKAHS